MSHIRETDSKELNKKILAIALPAVMEGALMSIISSIDTMMVGALGPAAIAAVGITAQPRMLLLVLVQALCVGTTALVARRKGEGDMDGAASCLGQSLRLNFALGLIISAVGYFFAPQILRFSGANDEILPAAADYFRIISLGFFMNCIQLCICAGFRAVGKTNVTFLTHALSNGVNVVMNFALIGGRLGFPALGVRGAAIATLMGTVCAGMIALYIGQSKKGPFALPLLRLPRLEPVVMQRLVSLGTATASEALFLRGGFLLLQRIVASLGTKSFAAYQIVSQVTSLSFTLGDGIAAASVALVGQALGAKDEERAKRTVRQTQRVGAVASVLLMLIILFTAHLLPRLFTVDEAVIKVSTLSFYVVLFGIHAQNGRVIGAGCLRAAGDVRYVALCSFLGVTALRPALTYLMCYPVHDLLPGLSLKVVGPWVAYVLDAFLRQALLSRRIQQGKWLKISI